jgi:peptidoglycan/LPS O-acetylase OafA/YrhL
MSDRKGFFALDLLDNRYPALHGLRVIAIFSVIAVHVTSIFGLDPRFGLDETYAKYVLRIFFGMDLFFILSGFLIGSILLRSLAEHGTQNIRRFYIRRIFRTFPSYYVVLTLMAVLLPLTYLQKKHLWVEYVYGTNIISISRDSVLMTWGWSLALEEQFYLTVPLLFVVLHKLPSAKSRLWLLGLVWASALFIRLGIYVHGAPWQEMYLANFLYFRTHTRFDTLIAGIFLAFLHANHRPQVDKWLEKPLHRGILACTALLCLKLLMDPDFFGAENTPLFRVFAWGTITSIMHLSVLVLVLHRQTALSSFLGHPVFRKMATLGYGVYLVHIPIGEHAFVPLGALWLKQGWPTAPIWPIATVGLFFASLAVGYVMHIFIEKPSLKIRDYLAK